MEGFRDYLLSVSVWVIYVEVRTASCQLTGSATESDVASKAAIKVITQRDRKANQNRLSATKDDSGEMSWIGSVVAWFSGSSADKISFDCSPESEMFALGAMLLLSSWDILEAIELNSLLLR